MVSFSFTLALEENNSFEQLRGCIKKKKQIIKINLPLKTIESCSLMELRYSQTFFFNWSINECLGWLMANLLFSKQS